MTTRPPSLWFAQARLPGGWADDVRVAIRDGRIAAVETGVPAAVGDERHVIALPGVPNLHSHAFQRGMAGLAERRGPAGDSFWTWREIMYRFVARIGPDELEAIAALAFAEMLESGFTRAGEFHYLHHAPDGTAYADPAEMGAALAAAAARTGIALTLLPVFYAQSGFGGAAPTAGQRRFVTDPDRYARLVEASHAAVRSLPDAIVGIAPHSLRAVTPASLAAILPLGRGGPIHIHVAEQQREVADCLAWSGARPVEWLLDHAPVGPDWCLVHATHMTEAETGALAASGAVAGLCPVTEANLGDGLFPAIGYAAAGGRWGVGSDSNVAIDLAEELRLLEYGQRLTRQGRNLMAEGEGGSTGTALFDAALAGGTQALGVSPVRVELVEALPCSSSLGEERLFDKLRASGEEVVREGSGGISAGASADLVSLDPDHPALVGRGGDALLDALVFAGGRGAIDCVWRGGRKCVERRRHVARAAIVTRYREVMRAVLAG